MIYVMSDLHGEYEKYMTMLQKINFSREDTLYILGDVVDRGEEPVKILKDMASRENIYPIIGNHELMALDILKYLMVEITDENYSSHITADTLNRLTDWRINGGDTTLEAFQRLPMEERFSLIEYMDEFAPYETVDVGDKTYIMVHSGLGNFSKNKRMREYSLEELTFMRHRFSKKYFRDDSIFIICGHTPTVSIWGKPEIYYSHNNICIDCGAVYGGKLACLCLDTMEEFYV